MHWDATGHFSSASHLQLPLAASCRSTLSIPLPSDPNAPWLQAENACDRHSPDSFPEICVEFPAPEEATVLPVRRCSATKRPVRAFPAVRGKGSGCA